MSDVRSWVHDHRDEYIADLISWLRIPSVSADPARQDDVRRSAHWFADQARAAGFPTVEIWLAAGPDAAPAVFAEWLSDDPAATTVLVYGHHDVQPVDPLELWTTPPFEPTLDGDVLRGRGSADDKGQMLYHLFGLRAHLAAVGRSTPAVNLKMLVEGEEESGSPHFPALLRANVDRLKSDVIVVSDTGLWDPDTPSICTGMRGLIGCQVDFHGPDTDLHSGSFGGAVPNPLTAMAGLIAKLHDENGHVTVDGFYDDVVTLTDRERELFAKLPFDEADWLSTAASRAAFGEAGYSTLERVWARPTAEVNGFWGGYNGPGHKTIVPSDAYAKLSFRLVAHQQPDKIRESIRAFVEENTPPGITATVHFEGDGVRPCLVPLDAPGLQAATRALERAFEKEVLYIREGGSGPEADLAEILATPLVFLGIGLPTDKIHAPNEHAVVSLLLKGAEAVAYLWEELSTSAEPSAAGSVTA
jgi:acetylornithine deacetylase/succinyl-diaminopimelate desuccinylase-like protein